MSTYTVYNAKTHLSSLIDEACAGEEVIIARGKLPLVKLVPLRGPGQGRRFGAMRGRAALGRLNESFAGYSCAVMVAGRR